MSRAELIPPVDITVAMVQVATSYNKMNAFPLFAVSVRSAMDACL